MCRQAVQCRRSMVFISKKWDVSMRKLEWKKKNRHWSHIADRQGFTLVELIVTFALLAIFMTAVVACLPNITKIYTNLQAINHQKTICNTVSNQIRNELQSALGVEGVDDALGANKSKEIAYIALIDDSGNPITLTTGGAVSTGGALSTGGAIQPDTVSGRTIEFVLRDGIIAQLDTKGFTGYTMRKNKKMLHRTRTISPGALLTRYYELDDSDNKLMGIQYNSTDYSVASDAGIVNEGPVTIACAIDYPYAGQFYEGYDLETTFTIKKDAFYSYGDGTTASPKRTYVSYINYTLSLWKDGHMKYAQDYVVNVQNAVPYLGTKVAVDPVVPDVPSMSGTYVVPGTSELTQIYGDNKSGAYKFNFHIEHIQDTNGPHTWMIELPANINLKNVWNETGIYTTTGQGNIITVTLREPFAFVPSPPNNEFTIYYNTNVGLLDDPSVIEGSQKVACTNEPIVPNATDENSEIRIEYPYKDKGSIVQYWVTPKEGVENVKVYMKIKYDKEVKSAKLDNTWATSVRFQGDTVYVYDQRVPEGKTYPRPEEGLNRLIVEFEGDNEMRDPVSISYE